MALLVAVILATFARTFVVQAFRVPSHSMEPGLLAGDHILVNKFIYGGERLGGWKLGASALPTRGVLRGDVAVFALPKEPWIRLVKRCIGLSGERITLDSLGLAVNGQRIDESRYLFDCRVAGNCELSEQPFSISVPTGHIACFGDRRAQSSDSRTWGPLPKRMLIGRPVVIYWSIPRTLFGEARSWGKISLTWWIRAIRWERSLMIVR